MRIAQRPHAPQGPRLPKTLGPRTIDAMAESALETQLRRRWTSALSPMGQEPASAAVAVLVAGPELSVALIRRATDPRDPWSGHMALPGGRRDPLDIDLVATATRETFEEVGIDVVGQRPWGALPSVSAVSDGQSAGLSVTAFLFRLDARPSETLNHEVAELLWVPLEELQSGLYLSEFRYESARGARTFPAWDIRGRIVWGLTHRILSTLLELPRGE